MRKQTFLAFTVFLALAGGAMWTLTRRPERGITRLNLTGIPQDSVDRIVLSGADAVELQRRQGGWQLANGKEADKDMVSGLLSNLSRIQTSDIITEDPSRFGALEVEGERAHDVALYAGTKELAHVAVGAASGGGTAVRDGKRVYRAMGLFSGAFSHPASQWRERRLLRDGIDQVARLDVRLAGKPPYALVRREATWELADPAAPGPDFRFDAQAADSLVVNLLNTRAQEIAESDPGVEATGLTDAADTMVLTLKGEGDAPGPTRTIRLGGVKDEATLYASVSGNPELFLLPTYAGNTLRKSVDDLRAMTVTTTGTTLADVKAIAVRHGRDRFRVVRAGTEADAGWEMAKGSRMPKDFQLDRAQVDRRIHDVINARAVGMATDQAAAARSIKPGAREVTLELADGSKRSIAFGGAAKEQPRTTYARGSADAGIYILSDYLRDTMTAPAEALKRQAPAGNPMGGLDPATLSGLPADVRAKLMAQH